MENSKSMKLPGRESGAVIVEATIVFPVMFLVIFFMLFAGNAYYQKARIDSIIHKMATDGAAYCADPLLRQVESGNIPSASAASIKPYRFLIGGMHDIESDIAGKIKNGIKDLGSGIFAGMKPSGNIDVTTDFVNRFIYSNFSVEVSYKIVIPIKLLGASDFVSMKVKSRVDLPVPDMVEFIRNVDMIEDFVERLTGSTAADEIGKVVDKVKEWSKK